MNLYYNQIKRKVSTHSRPKAAAHGNTHSCIPLLVSTHSRPKAAAITATQALGNDIGFNTQPPEGGCKDFEWKGEFADVSTHSRPKAAAFLSMISPLVLLSFQHTAARRRLPLSHHLKSPHLLFQHTAARRRLPWRVIRENSTRLCFNTQPPEGGCGCANRSVTHH